MLKNALGERAYIASRIGELSDQTEMLLKKSTFLPQRSCTQFARKCPIWTMIRRPSSPLQ